ncbi:peptidase [Clostridia bacterium]|nr:peptidase [Clostridia bacterium]
MFYIDAHCDSVSSHRQLDFKRLRRAFPRGGLQFMACFALNDHYTRINCQLDALDALGVQTVTRHSGLAAVRAKGGFGMLRAIEGGECLDGDVRRVDEFRRRGVRCLGLTWNNANALSGGAKTPDVGLTDFGREVIDRLENRGMLTDLAHISRAGFWDALEVARRPPIVSHACAAALCAHPRNLDDAQLRALAAKGGVIGIALYPDFLSEDCHADIDRVAAHIIHVYRVAGRESVGLGTDFDGIDTLPDGINDVSDMPKLYDALRACGMKSGDADLVMGGNFYRVIAAQMSA